MWNKFVFSVVVCIVLSVSVADAANWVLLVAGSNGWENYRHQADICHSYHIFKARGIPESNIVVMMYDDIANNSQNPFPGAIYNYPGGPNVYPGVVIDYRREDVNSTNFLNILTGNKEAMKNVGSGKVIESGPDDKVFVYFSDHGGPGLLAFPNADDLLSVQNFSAAIKSMKENSKYKEMVFYIEACEAGSMFWGWIPDDIHVYSFTASDPNDSSYGCFCNNDTFGTCLGDCYSVAWMLDTETKDTTNEETFEEQYVDVAEEVANYSVPQTGCQYGDLSMTSELLAEFFGKVPVPKIPKPTFTFEEISPVKASEMTTHFLIKKLYAETDPVKKSQIEKQLDAVYAQRARTEAAFKALERKFVPNSEPVPNPYPLVCYPTEPSFGNAEHMDCVHNIVAEFRSLCGKFDAYAGEFSKTLYAVCRVKPSMDDVRNVLRSVCTPTVPPLYAN